MSGMNALICSQQVQLRDPSFRRILCRGPTYPELAYHRPLPRSRVSKTTTMPRDCAVLRVGATQFQGPVESRHPGSPRSAGQLSIAWRHPR